MLRSILAVQYAPLVPRVSFARRLSMSRPCQKSPSQKTATLSRQNTISGQPGRALSFTRYRSPVAHNARRSLSSHRVSYFLLAARAAMLARSDAAFSPANDGVFSTSSSTREFSCGLLGMTRLYISLIGGTELEWGNVAYVGGYESFHYLQGPADSISGSKQQDSGPPPVLKSTRPLAKLFRRIDHGGIYYPKAMSIILNREFSWKQLEFGGGKSMSF